MDLNIAGQYRTIAREQEKLKKKVKEIDRKFLLLETQLKHANDIKIARRQIKKKELIPQKTF